MTPVRRVSAVLVLLWLIHHSLPAQLLVETFDYPAGQLTDLSAGANVSGGKWATLSGTGNPVMVTPGSLVYSGYASSGGGNMIALKSISSSAEDVAATFGQRNAGTIFVSFLLSVTDTTGLHTATDSVGDYFAALLPGTSSTTFVGRLSIRRGVGKGTFQLGIRTSSSNTKAAWAATDLTIDSTHLVVFSYGFVTGSKNDTCALWINPDLRLPRPAPHASQPGAATSEPGELSRLAIRQDGTDTPDALIDGIRIGTTWEESPLPIQLIVFEGIRIAPETVHLEWTTQSEINNYGFGLLRSCDGSEFHEIESSFVPGSGTTLQLHRYTFTDSSACPGVSFYRLQQIDLDGTLHLSERIVVSPLASILTTVSNEVRLFPCFPNPFNPKTEIRFEIGEGNQETEALRSTVVTLKVYDLLGREVAVLVDGKRAQGTYRVVFDASHLPSGVYVCRLTAGRHVACDKIILTR
jgi:hypothetical protein